MQCPQCKSRSVIIKDGQKKCQAKGCTFIEFHVITYENQNRQFQGEKGTENRFNPSSLIGQNVERQQPKYERNAERAGKVIKDLIHTMKLSSDLQDRAMAKLLQILKIKYPEDKNYNGIKEKNTNKITNSDQDIAAFSLWLACCDKKMEFKDARIANQMRISKSDWLDMHKELQTKVKSIMSIPTINPESCIRRICTKRKINLIEQNAMLEMLKRIKQGEMMGGKKSTTIAGFVFWQIMKRSETYNKDGKFHMLDYLVKKGGSEGKFDYWTQKQIDISENAIVKYKNEDIGNKLQSLIPYFKTRMNANDN